MTGRRGISLVMAALLFAGCSKAVVIPRDDLANEKYRAVGDYRIKLRGWNEYHARKFSVTDSTVVIEELKQSDDLYKQKRHDMPIVIPNREVEYIGEMQANKPMTVITLVGIGLAAAFVAWLSTIHWDSS
jgi:hypothetical protein